MVNVNTRYNFDLNCYPLLKLKELYPIDNTVVLMVTGIPISDLYSEYLEAHIGEMCDHFKKDLILKVNIPNIRPGTPFGMNYLSIDELGNITNVDSTYDNDSWESYDEAEYDDYYPDDDEEYDDEYDDCPEYNMIEDDFVNESYDEMGLFYNFSRVFPVIDGKGNEIYHFEDTMQEYSQASVMDDASSSEINEYIDTDGDDWMFLFQFRHPISYENDLNPSQILQPETIKMADKVTFSLMNAIGNGIANLTNTDTMRLIIKAMVEIASYHVRAPFVGNVRFQVIPEKFSQEIQYNYYMWNTELYNLMLEDFVNFEEKITPPFTIEKGEYYFKPTDFLGEYYFPHGIKIRKEEENGGKENDIKEDNKTGDSKKPRTSGRGSKGTSGEKSAGGRASRSGKSKDLDGNK